MSLNALTAPRLFNGEAFVEGHAVLVEADTILGLVPRADIPSHAAVTTLPSGVLAPGFVDAQVNGGGGFLFNQSPDVATLEGMVAAHRRHGQTKDRVGAGLVHWRGALGPRGSNRSPK